MGRALALALVAKVSAAPTAPAGLQAIELGYPLTAVATDEPRARPPEVQLHVREFQLIPLPSQPELDSVQGREDIDVDLHTALVPEPGPFARLKEALAGEGANIKGGTVLDG